MSYQPLWLRDLVAYSIQAAALVAVGVVMARVLRLRMPRFRMAYWQGLLALCLFLPLLQPWRREVLQPVGSAMSSVTLAAGVPAAATGLPLAEIILLILSAGIAVRAAWMALGMVRLWLYRRQAQRIAHVPPAVEEARRLVPVVPALFISSRLQTPATFGYFRPAILFPARFLQMEPSMQKAIALHELLHVERRDWIWNLLEEGVLTLLWFHLPLWWAVRSIRLSREQVVDAEAVRRGNARRPYLKALLEMAGQKRLAESLPAALFLRESQLAERVALMMKEAHMSRKRLTVSILASASVLLIAGASVVWAFPLRTSAQQAEPPAVSSAAASSESGAEPAASPSVGIGVGQDRTGQKSGKIYKVGDGVRAPIPIYKPEPPYTPQARKAKYQGTCVLWIIVDAQGNVTNAQIVKPLGMGLDENALTTVKTWKFKPAMRYGVPVPVKVMVEVSFRYDHDKKPGAASPKPDPQPNPQAQVKPPAPEASKENGQAKTPQQAFENLNSVEMQRKLQEAMKQAEKLNTPEMRQRMQEAMKQAEKLNSVEMQQKLQEAMKQAEKLNTPEMRQQMQEAMKQAEKLNSAQMQRKFQDAMKQAEKLNSAEMQQRFKQDMEQAKLAQLAASKIDQAKIQKQVAEAMKQLKEAKIVAPKIDEAEIQRQVEQAMKQAQEALKQARKAQQKAKKQLKELKPPPLPPTPHLPKELPPPPQNP